MSKSRWSGEDGGLRPCSYIRSEPRHEWCYLLLLHEMRYGWQEFMEVGGANEN